MTTKTNEENKLSIDDEVKKLAGKDYSKIIKRDDLNKAKNKCLHLSGNGTGDRWCRKIFDSFVIYANGSIKVYSENSEDTEEKYIKDDNVKKFFEENKINKNNKNGKTIIGIKIIRKRDKKKLNRPIRRDILKKIREQPCVVCGSNSNIVCDHKNDLYNDPRVLNTKTQTIEDFQSLCNSCNLRKRAVAIKEKKEKRLYGATNMPQFKSFGIDFIGEKKEYDETDPNNKVGTYWYDPVAFTKHVYNKLKN